MRRAIRRGKRRKPHVLPLNHLRYKSNHAGGLGGQLPKYAWPGGYPIYYATAGYAVLCPKCANKQGRNHEDPVTMHDVNWEDPSLYCEDCQERIESAYAEDEAK
jgi:hypothetical protein